MHTMLLLLLLLLLLLPVKYVTSTTMYSAAFLWPYIDHQDENRPKHCYLYTFFLRMGRNTVFCNVFLIRPSKMYGRYQCFLLFYYFQLSNQTSQKHLYLQCLTRQKCIKPPCLEAICRIFSARALQCKKQSFLAPFLPPLIRTQQGVKLQTISKMHLKWTTMF